MRGVHLKGYSGVEECEITAVCDINEEKLKTVGDQLGLPQNRRFTDYRELIACDDVDAVDIATWNSVHCEIAQAAALAGKSFSVEKPVGMSYAEVHELNELVKKQGVESFVCLSWRYHPYTRYMRSLIKDGIMGKIFHIYVRCIKNSGLLAGRKREWRFDASRGGSGVLGDLGSHMIDIVHFLGQEFKEIYASAGILIKERPSEETGELVPVDTDDWCNMTATLESEACCTIQVSRCAATLSNLMEIEIFGENGRFVYRNDNNGQTLEFTDAKTKEKKQLTPTEEFDAVQSRSFINLINGTEDEYAANLSHGLECQAVIEAAIISTKENRSVTVAQIKNCI